MFVGRSSICWYYLLSPIGIVWCTIFLFACMACFQSLSLGAEDFENLQELDVQDFEQQLAGEQGK
jgi:hypothetical protein